MLHGAGCNSVGRMKIIISCILTQDERWMTRYNEVKEFIETTHRNPSRHFVENRNLLSWIKQQRKLLNAGKLKAERIESFKRLLGIIEENKHINQYI